VTFDATNVHFAPVKTSAVAPGATIGASDNSDVAMKIT
jgi:hypothetical protein